MKIKVSDTFLFKKNDSLISFKFNHIFKVREITRKEISYYLQVGPNLFLPEIGGIVSKKDFYSREPYSIESYDFETGNHILGQPYERN